MPTETLAIAVTGQGEPTGTFGSLISRESRLLASPLTALTEGLADGVGAADVITGPQAVSALTAAIASAPGKMPDLIGSPTSNTSRPAGRSGAELAHPPLEQRALGWVLRQIQGARHGHAGVGITP